MIDPETERAVEGWVKLGDAVAPTDSSDVGPTCSRCGSMTRVLGRGPRALCTRCYLERGELPAAG